MFRRSISIHAPARGATATVLILPAALPHFNPRSRKGSDFIDLYPVPFDIAISIHAPARGATASVPIADDTFAISIHAPARGATGQVSIVINHGQISIHAPARGATAVTMSLQFCQIFQSTLPQGERPYFDEREGETCGFQSTLPQGERLPLTGSPDLPEPISIHAPARGATSSSYPSALPSLTFQSTLPQGERRRLRSQTLQS